MSTEQRALQLFMEQFGGRPETVGVAPGRVNLIGEHTDYNEGFVFPAAIDREVWVCARRTDGESALVSAEMGTGEVFDTFCVGPGDTTGWSSYAAGMAWGLRTKTGRPAPNIEALVHGEVPIGGGVSSSAAIEMAFGVVWNRLAKYELENPQLALIGQQCENRYVGVNSGIMDQMASAMGRAGQAMFLDTRSLQIEYAPLPSEVVIVLCDTGKQRTLAGSAYNERRAQCEEAARALGVKSLRDASLEQLEAGKQALNDVIYRRARHVVTENARCVEFKAALEAKDLVRLGALMRQSHESLRDDYEVSCKELDEMASSAWESKGCIGARMTGAGFGGACVALARSEDVADFIAETAVKYKKRSDLGGNFIACRAAQGARTLL